MTTDFVRFTQILLKFKTSKTCVLNFRTACVNLHKSDKISRHILGSLVTKYVDLTKKRLQDISRYVWSTLKQQVSLPIKFIFSNPLLKTVWFQCRFFLLLPCLPSLLLSRLYHLFCRISLCLRLCNLSVFQNSTKQPPIWQQITVNYGKQGKNKLLQFLLSYSQTFANFGWMAMLLQFYFARYLYTVKLENVIHQQALIALYAFIIHEPGCLLKWS